MPLSRYGVLYLRHCKNILSSRKGKINGKRCKEKKENKCFSMRKHYDFDKFWKPGMPVTDEDLKLLEEVKAFYCQKGYVPIMKEISNVQKLKSRFRTWKNVLIAAELPSQHDSEQQKKRQQEKVQESNGI